MFNWAAEQVRRRVDDSTWRAFWLTAVENHGGRQVADELGMAVGAVYVAKSRVLAQLRRCIAEMDADFDPDTEQAERAESES